MTPQVGEIWWTFMPHEPFALCVGVEARITECCAIRHRGTPDEVYGYQYELLTDKWGVIRGQFTRGYNLFKTKEELMDWFKVQNKQAINQLLKSHGHLLEAWRRGDYDD